ncbi:MAG: thiamine-monophosphate kinase [Phycisphaerales bacterium]|nr:thiamine-monophosphate kinase [Phycisphaerales bacterium]
MTRESELLRHIYERSRALRGAGGVEVGPGDDAAVLEWSGGRLLATVDQLVEGRHYDPRSTPVDLIARKAVARSVSDIAAMGGEPVAALAAGALREGFAQENELFDAMARWAGHWRCPLVGGDIARVAGPSVLSVTVLGRMGAGRRPVLRSGARDGDTVYVTGALGGSLRSGRHLTFEPRLQEGAWLCETLGDRLHAMMDLSDGLGRDGARLAEASGVGLEVSLGSLALHSDAPTWREGVGDGEDYELLFAASGPVPGRCPTTGTPISSIGKVVEGSGCFGVTERGERVDLGEMGWDHAG